MIISFILLFFIIVIAILFSNKINSFINNIKLNKLLKNNQFKELFNNYDETYSRVDLKDSELSFLTKIFNQEKILTHSACTMRYRTTIHYNNKNEKNGRTLKCNSLNVVIQKLEYINNEIVYLISIESHYGSPYWNGKKMSYDYHIGHESYFIKKNNIQEKYFDILNNFFYVSEKENIPKKEIIQNNLFNF